MQRDVCGNLVNLENLPAESSNMLIGVGFALVRFIGECDLKKKKLKFLWFILEIHRTVDNNNKTC